MDLVVKEAPYAAIHWSNHLQSKLNVNKIPLSSISDDSGKVTLNAIA